MKKIFIISMLVSISMLQGCKAEDLMYTNDMWDNYGSSINEGKEAKPVTDEEFEKAIKQKDAKVNKWRNWFLKRNVPKGENFSKSNETEVLNKEHGADVSLPVITLPFEIVIGETNIPVGHYQVKGENINGTPVLKFYQASDLIVTLPATETSDDFNQDEILFVNWLPINDNSIKIIYGSLDFNAYSIVNISNN